MSKKALAVFLSLLMIMSCGIIQAAAVSGDTDYTIVNPYETVDWDTWQTYKANLHTHTEASDGKVTVTQMAEIYYDHGYDVLAITDHGVINYGWTAGKTIYPIFNGFRDITPMSQADYDRITSGSDRGGRGMTDVAGGIEINNGVISKTHVNGYFTTYGNGEVGIENDYKTATVEVDKTGGLTVLNHIGDWTDGEHYPERSHWPFYIEYFYDIFNTTHSCVGMEVVNSNDRTTHADRALWDELLQVVIPTGRNIWGFADDDSEYADEYGRSWEELIMPSNTVANVRTAMENGTFFASSRYDKTDTDNPFEGVADSTGIAYEPRVSRIDVDQEANTITVTPDSTRDWNTVEWVANGKVIATGTSIDLNDYEDQLGCYIRFQIKGSGGVTYSQPFELKYSGRVDKTAPHAIADFVATPFGKVCQKLYHTLFFTLMTTAFDTIVRKIKGL